MSARRTPLPAVPRDVGPTSARQHITGSLALNIPYPRFWSSGDWHEHSAWFGAESDQVSEYSLASEQVHGPLLDKLGNSGLRDARGGLATLGHPAARQSRRIWAATHEPAVLEWCWSRIDEHTKPASPITATGWSARSGSWASRSTTSWPKKSGEAGTSSS